MPDPNQDFIDAVSGSSSGADPNQDFIDAVGGGSGGTPAPSPPETPETDKAIGGFGDWMSAPSPPWLRRFEDPVRAALTRRAIPEIPTSAVPSSLASTTSAINAVTGIATPANAIMAGAMALQPETAPFLLPTMMAPIAGSLIQKAPKVIAGTATPQESGEAAADVAMLLAPGAHMLARGPRPFTPIAPLPPGRVAGPLPESEIPPPPMVAPEVDKPTAKERDYAFEPSNAQVEGGAAPLGVEQRPSSEVPEAGSGDNVVGETQRVEARGNVPGVEPQPTGEIVAPSASEADASRLDNLANEINSLRQSGSPVPLAMTQEFESLERLDWTNHGQIVELKEQAADLKNQVGDYLGKKGTKEQYALQDQLWDTYDKIHKLREASGQPRDVVIIGGGAAALKAAGHAAYEGLDAVVLEKELSMGGQAKRSQEIVNVGAGEIGIRGRDYFMPRELTARNRGAQLRTNVEVVNMVPRTDGGVDVVTKNHGIIPARRVMIATGASGNIHPNMELAGWGNAERLTNMSRGKVGMVYGAGNSASQAVFGAIARGAKKIIIASRHPFGPEVSADQKERILDLVKKGKVELVTGSVTHIARDEATGGVKVTIGDKEYPVAHIENFLDTKLNTGWLPEGVDKVGKSGAVKVLGPSLKTTMPGVYVAGDIRESQPGELRARRIDIAEGDAAGVITRIHDDLEHQSNYGKFPPWQEISEPPEGMDQHLKVLKGLKTETSSEAAPSPSSAETTGPKIGSSPQKSETTSPETSSTSAKETPKPTPAGERRGIPESSKAIAEGRRATMYGGEGHQDYTPFAKDATTEANARLAANPRYPDKLISDLSSGKKIDLDPVDESILVNHREALQNARDMAGKRALDKSLPQNERANAAANFEDLNSQLEVMNQATGDGRLLRSKSQNLAWHQFRARDYGMDSMKQKLQIAKDGVPLTKEETAKLKKGTDKLSSLMTAVAAKKAGALPGQVPPGLRELQYEMHKAKTALDDMVFHEKFSGKPLLTRAWYTGRELLAVPRALMASMDLSAIRRQGGVLFASHPIRSMKIIPDMLRATKSDKAYFSLMQEIRERPNAPLYQSSKLGLTEIKSPKLSDMEEMYLSRWADYIPGVSHSQRAYVYYLNRLRADSFDAMAKTLGRKGQVTPKQADALSNFINVFTGRGTIPAKYANAAVILNDAFFAPRYVLSRFQVVTGQPLRYAKDPAVRRMIAGEYARALIGYGIMYSTVAIAAEALGQKIEVSFDPRSTEFGKIKIGDTRIDPLSGLSQAIVLLTRLAPPITGKLKLLGHTKTAAGIVQPVWGHGPMTQRGFGDILTDFGRSKLAPLPSAIWNTAESKKVTGEPTTLTKELLGMLTPLSGNDIYQAMVAHGVPAGAALGLLAFLGDSVNTYSRRGVSPKKLKALKPR